MRDVIDSPVQASIVCAREQFPRLEPCLASLPWLWALTRQISTTNTEKTIHGEIQMCFHVRKGAFESFSAQDVA